MGNDRLDFTQCQTGAMETSKLLVAHDQMELTGDYENSEHTQSNVVSIAPGNDNQLVQKVCKVLCCEFEIKTFLGLKKDDLFNGGN